MWLALGASDGPASTWPEVAAILDARCVACHSGELAPLGLALDSFEAAMAGSENGPVLISGDTATSPLLRRVRGEDEPRMPLDGPPFLSDDEIALMEAWIAAGAPGPATGEAAAGSAAPEAARDARITYSDIDRILKRSCIVCHSDSSALGAPPEDLRLTGLDELLAGGDRIVVIPGNPEASELWRRVAGRAMPRMPMNGPPWLPEAEIAMIRTWIAEGAVDDEGRPAPMPTGAELRIRGLMTGRQAIDGVPFEITGATRVDEHPRPGQEAELRGVVGPGGTIIAERLRDR